MGVSPRPGARRAHGAHPCFVSPLERKPFERLYSGQIIRHPATTLQGLPPKFQIGIGGTPRSRERTLKRLDTPHHISSPVEQGRDQNTLNVIASAPHRLPLDIVVFDKGCCGSSNMSRFVEGLRAGNRPPKPLFFFVVGSFDGDALSLNTTGIDSFLEFQQIILYLIKCPRRFRQCDG